MHLNAYSIEILYSIAYNRRTVTLILSPHFYSSFNFALIEGHHHHHHTIILFKVARKMFIEQKTISKNRTVLLERLLFSK